MKQPIMHRPIPGPAYWDFKCLRCDGAVSDHAPWWRRGGVGMNGRVEAAALTYHRGAVIKYRGKMGLSWIAWAGHDDYYNEVWYCQRRDSVNPGAPRAVTHAELLEEIGTIEDALKGDDA